MHKQVDPELTWCAFRLLRFLQHLLTQIPSRPTPTPFCINTALEVCGSWAEITECRFTRSALIRKAAIAISTRRTALSLHAALDVIRSAWTGVGDVGAAPARAG